MQRHQKTSVQAELKLSQQTIFATQISSSRMKYEANGGMLMVFSINSWWGVQDIVDFGPMKVQAE